MFRLAAEFNANCHVHIRTTTGDASNVEEVLDYSRQSGAPLHIVHINSSGQDLIPQYLEVIRKAQESGVDVTTECYPYNRGSTFIESHLFDDWETFSDEKIGQHIWIETGEHLTRESFGRYREQGGILVTQPAYSMEMVRAAVASPLTLSSVRCAAAAKPRSTTSFAGVSTTRSSCAASAPCWPWRISSACRPGGWP